MYVYEGRSAVPPDGEDPSDGGGPFIREDSLLGEMADLSHGVIKIKSVGIWVDAARNEFLDKAVTPFYNPLSSLKHLIFSRRFQDRPEACYLRKNISLF